MGAQHSFLRDSMPYRVSTKMSPDRQRTESQEDLEEKESSPRLISWDPLSEPPSGQQECVASLAPGVYGWRRQDVDWEVWQGNSSAPKRILPISSDEVCMLASGKGHACLLLHSGQLYCWGSNSHHQIGHDNTAMIATSSSPHMPIDRKVVHVACGSNFTAAITEHGSLLTFGDNEFGQCGHATGWSRLCPKPKEVKALGGEVVIDVACGSRHTIVLTRLGAVWSFGNGDMGQLGHPTTPPSTNFSKTEPRQIISLRYRPISRVFASHCQSAALTHSGLLLVWGSAVDSSVSVADITSASNIPLHNKSKTLAYYVEGTAALKLISGSHKSPSGFPSNANESLPLVTSTNHFCDLKEEVTLWTPQLVHLLSTYRIVEVSLSSSTIVCVSSNRRAHVVRRHRGVRCSIHTRHNGHEMDETPTTSSEEESNRSDNPFASSFHPYSIVVDDYCIPQNVLQVAASQESIIVLAKDAQSHPTQTTAIYHADLTRPSCLSEAHPSALKSQPIIKVAGLDYFWMFDQLGISDPCEVKQVYGGMDQFFFAVGPVGPKPLYISRQKISHISASECLRLDQDKHTFSLKSRITEVFGNMPCLLSSFSVSDDSFSPGSILAGLDCHALMRFYDNVEQTADTAIKKQVRNCIANLGTQICTIPFDTPESLRLWIILLAYPQLIKAERSSGTMGVIVDIWDSLEHYGKSTLKCWLASGPKSLLNVIVESLNEYLDYLIATRTALTPTALKKPVQFMRDIYDINVTARRIPYQNFYNPSVNSFLLKHTLLANDYMRWLTDSQEFSFCNHSFLLNTYTKSLLIRLNSVREMRQSIHNTVIESLMLGTHVNGSFTMAVRRERLLEDAMNNLVHVPATELKKPLRVVFVGEDGLDEGGVRKEFFQLVMRELFNPDFSMFIFEEDCGIYYFNPDTLETHVQFVLAGILIGLAIYNGILLPVHFPLAVWKRLLGVQLELLDVLETDPQLGLGLQALLEYPDVDEETVFCLNWEVVRSTTFGGQERHELVTGGSSLSVTHANKQQYVERYVAWRLIDSVKPLFDSFIEGFYRVCGGPVLTLFRPEELQEVVVGSTHLDMHELQQVTRYAGGFREDHPAITNFWQVVHSWPVQLQKKLLFFSTGSDRVPVGGLYSLKFVVHCSGEDSERLPTASTCFNTLYLPNYSGEDKMRRKLRSAIEYAHGFGLM